MTKTFGKLQSTQPQANTRRGFGQSDAAPEEYSPPALNVDAETYAHILGGSGGSGGSGGNAGYDGMAGGDNRKRAGRPVKGLRFVSGFVDSIVMGILFLLMVFLFADPNVTTAAGNQAESYRIVAMMIIPAMLYGILLEASPLQGTLGKIVTGTVVTDMNGDRISIGRAVGRNLGKLLSGIVPFYIPYWMVLFTENNQSLHDKMAGTLVFKRGEGPYLYTSQVFA